MSHHWGYVGALLAAVLFGVSATLNKLVLVDVHPLLVAGLIYFTAGLFLSLLRFSPLQNRIWALLKTPTKTETVISGRDYWILAFVIVFGSILGPILFLQGLNLTLAVNASLLLNSESLFTAFIALFFMGENVGGNDALGAFLLVLGAVLVTTNANIDASVLSEGMLGNLLILGACLAWGVDNNLSRLLSGKKDLVRLAALKCSVGGSVLLLFSLLLGINLNVPMSALPYLFTVGAFSIGLSIVLFLFALREIGSMRTGVIFSISSLFGAIFASLILSEPLTSAQLTGGLSMIAGVYALFRK